MAKEMIYAGLDLGTDQIKCVVVVVHPDGMIDVIGTGSAPAAGIGNGAVCDQEKLVGSIEAAVREASMMAGCRIGEVLLSISGRFLETFNSDGMVELRGETVSEEDIIAVQRMARAVKIPAEKEVLHVIPQVYVLDGEAIESPLGMAGVRLEIDAHVVLANSVFLKALEKCCRKAKLRVIDVLLAPLVQAEALLTPQARDLGVVLVDIGADTTEMGVFRGGQIVYSSTLGIGGDVITLDLTEMLETPRAEAELLKQTHGTVGTGVASDETIELPGVGGRKPREIARTRLCAIIEARVEEVFTYVREDLEQAGFVDYLAGGIVLTGGGSKLNGMVEVAERVLEMPAAIGEPKALAGLVEVVKHPRYATSTGLVLWGARERSKGCYSARANRRSGGLRRWLPWAT